jgi:hypothetical protein
MAGMMPAKGGVTEDAVIERLLSQVFVIILIVL